MELKPQDLLVLLKVVAHPPQRWTYAALGAALGMSASETHACVKRALAAGLAVSQGRDGWQPVRPALLEFMLHGARYVWPAISGPVKRGVPTAFGAQPLASALNAAPGEAPVWAHAGGSAKGPTLSPSIAARRRRRSPTRPCIACWPCSTRCAWGGRVSAPWRPSC